MIPASRIVAIALTLTGTAVAALAQPAPSAREERGALAIALGSDTLAVDRFIRTSVGHQGWLTTKDTGRIEYFVAIAPGELVTSVTVAAWPPGAATDAEPMQRLTIELRGDTAVAQTVAGTQRVPTKFGAVPLLNNAMSLIEIFTRRARSTGGSGEYAALALSGGVTLPARVTSLGVDSMLFEVAGQPHRLAVDAVGRILGGAIPAQGLRIIRLGPDATVGLTFSPPVAFVAPKPDYSAPPRAPYTATEVSFIGPKGIRLAGTLTLPKGTGPFPAVVTATGSGPQDRDQFIPIAGGIRLFRAIADTLGRRGIAVLRVDDRGVGASEGDRASSTTADFADDARAAVAWLRARKEIDPARIALVGHSEGGLIGPMVAAGDPQLRALVILAGPASSGLEVMKKQNRMSIDANDKWNAAQKDSVYADAVRQLESLTSSDPWLSYFRDYDPAATARKVKTPTLIVQGATDSQVLPEEAEKLAGFIRSGGNRDVTVKVLPDVNHLFVVDPDGRFTNYDKLTSGAVSTAMLGLVADWTAQRLAALRR